MTMLKRIKKVLGEPKHQNPTTWLCGCVYKKVGRKAKKGENFVPCLDHKFKIDFK